MNLATLANDEKNKKKFKSKYLKKLIFNEFLENNSVIKKMHFFLFLFLFYLKSTNKLFYWPLIIRNNNNNR